MVKFKDFSRPLSTFKANLFSRTFQDSPVYSSTFQACGNPGAITFVSSDDYDQHVHLNREILVRLQMYRLARFILFTCYKYDNR